jgi:hypothetical protein
MEVRNPVTAAVRTTVRTSFELFTFAFAIILPLAVIAFATMDINLPIWAIFTCGVVGPLSWWRLCWFAFWIIK